MEEEECTCLLDASQTGTPHKRGTSSNTHSGFFACVLSDTSFPSDSMHAPGGDTALLLGRRTEVEPGQPRSLRTTLSSIPSYLAA